MAICPFAEWRGPLPSSNYASGMRNVIGLTVHHMDGSWQSAEGRFKTPGAGASACFGVRYDGSIIQWVDTNHYDYHACQSQWEGYAGCENESNPNAPDAPPTPAQITAIARIARWLGVPAQAISFRAQHGIGYHRQFPGVCSQAWGQTACPGNGFVAAIPQIVTAMGGQLAPPGDDMKPLYISKKSNNAVGIYITDGVYKRWVSPDEWAFARFIDDTVSPLPLSDSWWDSIPTAH